MSKARDAIDFDSFTLSVVIPAFNEGKTLSQVLDKVAAVRLQHGIGKEIIVVDDGSTDNTREMAERYSREHPELDIRYFRHEKNQGKGAALHTGIQQATGDYLIIQDADLEYDPAEYSILLQPVLDGHADVVYGSRFIGGRPHRILFFWHTLGNKFLTFLSNMLTNLNLTDMETCYKLFRTDLIKDLDLQERRFGFEPEVTAKISRIPNIRIYEVGISYYGRTYEEGKKIIWKDGLHALYCISKYNLFAKGSKKTLGNMPIPGTKPADRKSFASSTARKDTNRPKEISTTNRPNSVKRDTTGAGNQKSTSKTFK